MFTSDIDFNSYDFWLKYKTNVSSYDRKTYKLPMNKLSHMLLFFEHAIQLYYCDT